MKIRRAYKTDLKNIMKMYKSCINGMINNGIDQWDENYPNTEIISQDVKNKTYYIAEEKEEIIGGINIDRNQDITYLDLNWEDNSNQFLVVHRLAVKEDFWENRTHIKNKNKNFFINMATQRITNNNNINLEEDKQKIFDNFFNVLKNDLSVNEEELIWNFINILLDNKIKYKILNIYGLEAYKKHILK